MERKIVIRKSRHFFERNARLFKTLGLALLVLSIPLTIFVLNQVQDIRQRAAGELVPLTSNFPQTGCPVAFNDVNSSSTQTYKVPVFCLNQTYCVTQGFDSTSGGALGLTFPSFGGDLPTTRKYALAFIAHYRNKAIPTGDPRHWDYNTSGAAGGIFKDVPAGMNLGGEIEAAQQKGFVGGQSCNSLYSPGSPYYDADPNVKCFDPDGNWVFGFNDTYIDSASGPGQKVAGTVLTRGAFLQQLYNYGINTAHQDLKLCMAAPPPVPPTATPTQVPVACNTACTSDAQCSTATGGCTVCKPNGTAAPIVDFTQLTGSSCPKNFAAKLPDGTYREPTYPSAAYRLATECLNKAYCVVQGYSIQTCPAGSSCTDLNPNTNPPEGYLGGELNTTRKFAVAFITRYHADAIAATDARHWNWVTPTGTVFKDVPLSVDLGREIETAAAKGFVTGAPCNTLYAPGDPYYSSDPNVRCFDPDGNWVYGFKGIEKSDYTTTTTVIKRGDFLQALYTYGTSPNHPDLAKCMSAPGTAGSCQPPPACNVGCMKDGDCTGAKDGCTVCAGATATTPGKCAPVAPTVPPVPACGTSCSTSNDCTKAVDGCTTCNSTTGKCSVAACNTSCSRDSDCAGAATKDGCTSCLGGKCQIPFNPGACKCDGIDATAIGTGQKVTFTAYSKVEGTDVTSAAVKAVNFRVFRGGTTQQDQIASSGFLPTSVITNTSSLIRYQTKWDYTVPADANNGDFFRVLADMQCVPKSLAIVPNYKQDKGIIAKVIDKVTEPIRTILGVSTGPTPTPINSMQISSFYPGEITQRDSCYLQFTIKR